MLFRMMTRGARIAASVVVALVGGFIFMSAADRMRLGASDKQVPQATPGEPFTAVTLELPGAPAWTLLTSGVFGAVVFGTVAWLFLGWLPSRRVHS